jgi:hypothetical protein
MSLARSMVVAMAFGFFPTSSETGGGVCNTCGYFADGLSLLMWINDWDFGQTIREVRRASRGRPAPRTQEHVANG